jgi:hypothetical protein
MGEAAYKIDLAPSPPSRKRATREEIRAEHLAGIEVEITPLGDGRWQARAPEQPGAEVIAETEAAADAQVRELAVRLGVEGVGAWFESQPEEWKAELDRSAREELAIFRDVFHSDRSAELRAWKDGIHPLQKKK